MSLKQFEKVVKEVEESLIEGGLSREEIALQLESAVSKCEDEMQSGESEGYAVGFLLSAIAHAVGELRQEKRK